MKTLLILRHAKSSWKDDDLADHDRPLKKRGKIDAEEMGKLIEKKDLVPQQIISSTAMRAIKTAKLVAYACGYDTNIHKEHGLYMASPEDIISVLEYVDDSIERVMIVGHNPGLEEFIAYLTDSYQALPTCALAYVELPIKTWKDIDVEGEAKLVGLWIPQQV